MSKWPEGVTPALSGAQIQESLRRSRAGLPASAGPTPPWPLVGECHSDYKPDHSCPQCDGSHDHQWRAWHEAPEVQPGTTVTGGTSGPGLPVRCRVCGGRKCDVPECMLRRHHRGDHESF